jgi:protoheme IX farnesyltransferase
VSTARRSRSDQLSCSTLVDPTHAARYVCANPPVRTLRAALAWPARTLLRVSTAIATEAQPVPPVVIAKRFARTRAYISLTKPRIVELLLVTTLPAMMLAAGGLPSVWLMLVVLVGGSLAAGGSSAINCYLDRDIDPLMGRTSRRPLATHVIAPRNALIFGLTLAITAVVLMAVFTNPLAAGLTAAAVIYYDVIYTAWLKRVTKHNTFWGGVCGALPVLIGWAAVTGSLAPLAWIFFGVVFFWQMPHFYALAIRFRDDYARAGIPMLPVVASPLHVARDAVVYAWLTVAVSLAAWPLGMSTVYGIPAAICGGMFILEAHGLYTRTRDGEDVKPMRLFHWSTAYLTIVFVAAAVDVFI